ncbi:MAG TPA: CHASE2 domain-containing protein [Cyclobacteriaceae bacterium]|nr:CHASE2 domain-containing protein [Cyclobacteriaceae bacterium]
MKPLNIILLILTNFVIGSCQSQPSVEDIVLINVGNYDKGRIAKELSIINSLNPKVVSLDVAFPEYIGDKDDIDLFNVLESSKGLVMASEISSLGEDIDGKEIISIALTCAVEFFPTHAKTGFVSAKVNIGETEIPNQFTVWQKGSFSEDIYYHFSLTTVMAFDSLKAVHFVNNNPTKVRVDYANGTRKFKTFSASEVLSGKLRRSDIEGKIVMFGFLGPGDKDKFSTPLNKNSSEPDMYGVEYLANVVAQILESK